MAKLLAPIAPVDIICIGLNYARHAAEGNHPAPEHPVMFTKSSAVLQHPGDPIELPRKLRSDEVDYECELAVVIGKQCKNATRIPSHRLHPRILEHRKIETRHRQVAGHGQEPMFRKAPDYPATRVSTGSAIALDWPGCQQRLNR